MLYNTQIHIFCKFGGVRGCWLAAKWLQLKKNKIRGLWPLGSPTKKVSTFFIIIAKVRSLPTFVV